MKRTRFKVVVWFGAIMAIICVYAIYSKMDAVAVILSGGIAGIVGKYTHDETKRPSNNDNNVS